MDLHIIKDYDTVIVGTGAAGYNAACRIAEEGKKSLCVVSEGILDGTSRNTGSDKQTYYKLGLGGSAPDSVRAMAETLFSGGAVDGDNALCEAALSARCFYNLCEAGVEFPHNRYGEYVGYKTDHDPFARATSAGPLTSKFMTEALEAKASGLGVKVFDRLLAVEILKNESGVCGLLCLDLKDNDFKAIRASNIILATGGPSGIYADSVYPTSHHGSTGLAIDAGATLQNMTEWQYGLASVSPRWNVSGTYMQVLPRFVSVDSEGAEREFLSEYFTDSYRALSMVFLKGYQWPFDIRKVKDGSSVIDLLVYRERMIRGRRVYLDFTKNPFGLDKIDFSALAPEAYEYLKKANADFGTPIERLELMNSPAIELYLSKGVDIRREYLEIALCSQHNNGGISVDRWWQTEVEGLFAAGECAGTHGVSRPGGSALNAGQVGSLRASQFVSVSQRKAASDEDFDALAGVAFAKHSKLCQKALTLPDNAESELLAARKRMSACAGAIRDPEKMALLYEKNKSLLDSFSESFGVSSPQGFKELYLLKDTLTTQLYTLAAMIDFSKAAHASRGSALYTDRDGEKNEGLEEIFRFSLIKGEKLNKRIQAVSSKDGEPCVSWRPVRPIPADNDFFENVWRSYRQNKNVD